MIIREVKRFVAVVDCDVENNYCVGAGIVIDDNQYTITRIISFGFRCVEVELMEGLR